MTTLEKILDLTWWNQPNKLKSILLDLLGQKPYKVYSARLSQAGTDAPVANVLENTVGEIVWSRDSEGTFNGTLTNGFVLDKTIGFFTYSLSLGDEIFMTVENIDVNTVQLINRTSTTTVQDGFSGQIEIRVYN